MAEVGMSEFQFGFGFLFEQTRREWANLRVAPILPSLQQEQNVGWDARLPLAATDYYYQFKLSDYLERTNAKYIRERIYSSPYLRIALHRRNQNRQHQRLKTCAASNFHTYYVAPEFDTIESFNSAFMNQQLLNRSRLIPVRDCKYVDDSEQHYITFQRGSTKWKFHSEEEDHENSIGGENLGAFYKHESEDAREVDDQFATALFYKAAETATTVLTKEHERTRRRATSRAEADAERRAAVDRVQLLRFDPARHRRTDVLTRTSQVLSVFVSSSGVSGTHTEAKVKAPGVVTGRYGTHRQGVLRR